MGLIRNVAITGTIGAFFAEGTRNVFAREYKKIFPGISQFTLKRAQIAHAIGTLAGFFFAGLIADTLLPKHYDGNHRFARALARGAIQVALGIAVVALQLLILEMTRPLGS